MGGYIPLGWRSKAVVVVGIGLGGQKYVSFVTLTTSAH